MSNVEEVSFLSTAIQVNQLLAYIDIASIALLVYDYLLTFKLEVTLFWGTPWNGGRFLYIWTRYMVFIDMGLVAYFHSAGGGPASIRTCKVVYQVSGWMILGGAGVAEIVLIFRTWLIWGRDRNIALGLLILLVVIGISTVYLTHRGLDSVGYIESPVPRIRRCFLINVDNRILFWDYLILLGFETVILIFTLIKGVRHYPYIRSSLVSTLYEDGILFYVHLTFISLANVIVLALRAQGASLILLQRVLYSMLTARILLHLRLAGLRDRGCALIGDILPVPRDILEATQQAELSTVIRGVGTWSYDLEVNIGDRDKWV